MYQFKCQVCGYDSGPCASLDAFTEKVNADGGVAQEVNGRFPPEKRLWTLTCPGGHGGQCANLHSLEAQGDAGLV